MFCVTATLSNAAVVTDLPHQKAGVIVVPVQKEMTLEVDKRDSNLNGLVTGPDNKELFTIIPTKDALPSTLDFKSLETPYQKKELVPLSISAEFTSLEGVGDLPDVTSRD